MKKESKLLKSLIEKRIISMGDGHIYFEELAKTNDNTHMHPIINFPPNICFSYQELECVCNKEEFMLDNYVTSLHDVIETIKNILKEIDKARKGL